MKIDLKLSNDFIITIVEISAGYFSPEQMDLFFSLVEAETGKYYFDRVAEANLLRIILGMYNKVSFLEECIKYPHYIEIICAVSVNSNYLTDILVRYPEYFYWIVNPSNLNNKLVPDSLNKSISGALGSYKSLKSKINFLKSLKRKELLRIGVKDILGIEKLPGVTAELSVLAKFITANLFDSCYREILNKYGTKKFNNNFCVISLGKLGGRELNYSSDIDLIIFYGKNIKISGTKDYQDFLSEVILLFIEASTTITDSGYLYRVDLRLRPDGRNSPLCNSFSDYTNYYESRGEDWERQMLIKGDFVTGDEKLYLKFYRYISHFIYPSNFSVSPLEQIKKMKDTIEKKLNDEENIKLSAGGIRNIEFCVQALQLLNGGKFAELQTSNTLVAIDRLKSKGLLSTKEAKILGEAYTFYRKAEHYLQLMNDTQTHTIPTDKTQLRKLSSFLGFSSDSEFNQKVKEFRKSVLLIYHSVIGEKSDKIKNSDAVSIKFLNPVKSEKNLIYLREGKGLLGQKQFDKKSIGSYLKIEKQLSGFLSRSSNPDYVVENFARIIRNANFPSIWYTEFSDKKFFGHFLTLCEFSQKSVNLFAEDKMLREIFLSKKVFEKLNRERLETLNTKEVLFYLSVQITFKIVSVKKASGLLCDYIRNKIRTEYDKIAADSGNGNFLVAAMGSFGSGEMTFSSDIDLIFVSGDTKVGGKNEKLFQRFLLQLKNSLKPFVVDCRLRPEGKSSQLVWDISAYGDYINNRARTWEFQSFCKLSFVAGSKSLFNRLAGSISSRIEQLDPDKLRTDISEMRKKLYPPDLAGIVERFDIKKSRGGIADIEFTLQFLMLINPDAFFKLKGADKELVVKFLSANVAGFGNAKEIIIDFYFLKSLSFASQVIFDSGSSSIVLDKAKTAQLSQFLNFKTEREFLKELKAVSRRNQKLFEKYVHGILR